MFKIIAEWIDDIVWPSVMLLFMLLAFMLNLGYDLGWNQFGVHPRQIQGALGIVFMPFLHGDWNHLFSNAIPLWVSMVFIFHYFPEKKWRIIAGIWALAGIGVWLYGAYFSNHIGASGILYGFVAFMLTSGFIRKNRSLWGVALLLLFMYGSMIWGLFPQYNIFSRVSISWEGHLSGTLAGIILAYYYKKSGPKDDPLPPDDEEEDLSWWRNNDPLAPPPKPPKENPPTINFIYKKGKDPK